MNKNNLKIILALIWSLFTTSLIVWWWVWALKLSSQISENKHNMIIYEGITLIAIVVIGSVFLIGYVWQDYKRQQKLRLFFSIFSHDIKTSISRLRLQAEVLEEAVPSTAHPSLQRLIEDVTRLDLQLENSLLFTNINNYQFFMEKTKMSQMIASIRADFAHLNIELTQDVEFTTDKKWFLSILKNIFQNSILHGKASRIQISAAKKNNGPFVDIVISDNGVGFNKNNIEKLGYHIYKSHHNHSNGIGLYLSKVLMRKLNGDLSFSSTSQGFKSHLQLRGTIL